MDMSCVETLVRSNAHLKFSKVVGFTRIFSNITIISTSFGRIARVNRCSHCSSEILISGALQKIWAMTDLETN